MAGPHPAVTARPWLESYPPGVPADYRVPGVGLPRLLEDAARDFPEATAVISGDDELTYAQVRHHAHELAAALAIHGVRAGDRVLVLLPTGVGLTVVLLGLWYRGAVAVPLSHHASAGRCDEVAARTGVVAVIATPAVTTRHDLAPLPTLVVAGDEWNGQAGSHRRSWWRRRPRRTGVHQPDDRADPTELADLLARARAHLPRDPTGPVAADRAPGSPALLVVRPTPAGLDVVEHTHGTLVAAAFQVRLWVPDVQAGRERLVVTEPLHEPVGLVLGLVPGLLTAATTILDDELATAVARHRPTLLVSRAQRLEDTFGGRDRGHRESAHRGLRGRRRARREPGSLRVCLSAGEGVSAATLAALEQRWGGARLRRLHGFGDAAPLTHGQPVYGRSSATALGLPVTGTLAAVVDPQDPTMSRPPGAAGMLMVRGPQIAVQGWLRTGELARMDEQGWFTRLGPVDHVVTRGDDVVPARRLREALCRHPGVTDAEVLGLGDRVVAVVATVRRGPDAGQLGAWLTGEFDARARPDRFLLLDRLPRTGEGELDRAALDPLLSTTTDGEHGPGTGAQR